MRKITGVCSIGVLHKCLNYCSRAVRPSDTSDTDSVASGFTDIQSKTMSDANRDKDAAASAGADAGAKGENGKTAAEAEKSKVRSLNGNA